MALTNAWTPLRHHALQAQAWRTTDRFVNLACGRGSGKTEIARRRIVRLLPVSKPWDDPLYFYALPTIAQAKRVAWDKLVQLIPKEWVKSINISNMFIETIFGSKLYVVGMDKPERIEGVQWDGCIIDESCDVKPGSFARSVVPALEHRNGWCWRIGVPKRYGTGAVEFKAFFDKGLSGSNGITSLTWPSSDILTPEQLAWAQENLDARDYNEQYNASWESIGGSIFYAFDDVLNVSDRISYNSSLSIIVGSDFNVSPMSWVIGHRSDDGLYIFDEISMRDTNTLMTLDALHTKYGQHSAGFEFYGDASGRARKTSAAASDYIQIKNDIRFHNARIYYPRGNPRIADRFASCNAMFCNTNKDRRLIIHPRCVNLIADLKYRSYKEGTREPDDHGDVGHMTDALGYVIYRRFPIRLTPHESPVIGVNAT